MKLRNYRPEDAPQLAKLFYSTIRNVNIKDYSQEQVEAWAPDNRDPDQWLKSFDNKYVIVAEEGDVIAGFGELEPNGHIDRFYIHEGFIGKGVGKLIYLKLEKEARRLKLSKLYVEASVTAMPFFIRMDFIFLINQTVELNNVILQNNLMEKYL